MFEQWQRELLDECRVACLATIAAGGRPRLVPVCYALVGDRLVMPVDEKPKRTTALARLRDIRRDPRVTLLADRYEEDWTRLAWVRVEGSARILDRGGADLEAIARLRARYQQYVSMALEDLPLIELVPERVTGWRWSGASR